MVEAEFQEALKFWEHFAPIHLHWAQYGDIRVVFGGSDLTHACGFLSRRSNW